MSDPKRLILFLYNHDAAHQAAHVVGIMRELALRGGPFRVIAATGTEEIRQTVQRLAGAGAARAIEWADLSLPASAQALLALPNAVLPARRLARLCMNEALFARADVIVSPERTCLRVRRRLRAAMGEAAPLFVFVPHGAGDRGVTYHPELAQFDRFLVGGAKVRDEMVARGIARPEHCLVTGYAKFDTVGDAPAEPLFPNDRPVILYNPHFDPHLSSWYREGPKLLAMLAARPSRWNVVFAPHVMLFRKKLHISPEYRVARLRPEIPQAVREAANVLVDTASPRLFDMTYTRVAGIYIGDVSSQLYEFLRRPRPCLFLDAAGEGAGAYPFWRNGPVFGDAASLCEALEDWRQIGADYRAVQQKLFAYTIDIDPDRSASQRGADALETILARRESSASG